MNGPYSVMCCQNRRPRLIGCQRTIRYTTFSLLEHSSRGAFSAAIPVPCIAQAARMRTWITEWFALCTPVPPHYEPHSLVMLAQPWHSKRSLMVLLINHDLEHPKPNFGTVSSSFPAKTHILKHKHVAKKLNPLKPIASRETLEAIGTSSHF